MGKSKKTEDIQSDWENKISRAKKVRKKWKDDFNVDLGIEYFEGRQKDGSVADADWITINNIYSHVKAQLPALYSTDPYFYVKLRRSFNPDPKTIVLWEARGKIRAAMLNYLKVELKLKEKMRISIQDGLFKYGVIKTHYWSETADNPDFGKPILAEDGETELKGEDESPLMEPESIPVNGRYKITRILPDDIIWDEDAGTLEDDWTWIAQRIRMTLEQAKKNPKYKKSALKELKGKGGTSDPEVKASEERKKGTDVKGKSELGKKEKAKDKESELITFWEIYNLKKKTWLTIAEDGENPVMDESPVPKGIELHPFSFLFFTPREDSVYPIPRVSQGLGAAKEYNKARSDIQKHRKRFNRKYEAARNAVGEDITELSKLESGDDGTVIMVNQTGGILPIKDAPLDQMRYQELGFLKAEMVELLGGSSDEARGIAGADSATQAGILDKRLEMKEGDAISMVVDFVTSIAKKLDQLVQEHIERDEAVHVHGPQGELWEIVKQSDYEEIDGEYEYSVNVGATLPRMPQMERASWQAFLALLSQFPQLLLSKRLLKTMAEQHHIEDEAMIDEMYALGQKMMSGQMPTPGNTGSQAGVSEDRPVSAIGGQAGGGQSMVTGNNPVEG